MHAQHLKILARRVPERVEPSGPGGRRPRRAAMRLEPSRGLLRAASWPAPPPSGRAVQKVRP